MTHNSFGEVAGAATTVGFGDPVYSYELERDQLGRIVTETETFADEAPVVWTYAYDERGRLEGVDKDGYDYEDYTYDANGNRETVTAGGVVVEATYNELDQLLTHDGWTYTHGPNGEVTSRTKGPDTWLYEYDVLGNLLEVRLPSDDKVRYEYDPLGRPIARYEYDAQTDSESYSKGWVWGDQLDPIAEVDGDGVVTARYVYGSRAHVPDYVVKNGVKYRIVSDYRGSVRAVVDGQGNVMQRMDYGRWGEVVYEEGAGFQNFGYAGGIWDAETGLVLFGARWYDPGTGRWMRRDPALFGGEQANLYVYARADGINFHDPEGLAPEWLARFSAWYDQNVPWLATNLTTIATAGPLFLAYGGKPRIRDGAILVSGGFGNQLAEWGSGAVTVGGVIFVPEGCDVDNEPQHYDFVSSPLMRSLFGEYDVSDPDKISLWAHEHAHAIQAALLGPAYFAVVAASYPPGWQDQPTTFIDDWANRWAINP